MSMRRENLLGKYPDKQVQAVRVIHDEGPMDYDSLQDELNLEYEDMQAVVRGVSYNGLANARYDESGHRVYYIEDDLPEEYYW